mgnify:CR=1 FL=1
MLVDRLLASYVLYRTHTLIAKWRLVLQNSRRLLRINRVPLSTDICLWRVVACSLWLSLFAPFGFFLFRHLNMTRDIYILPLLPRLLPSASVVFEEKGFLKLQTTHRFDHRVKRGYCFSLSPVEPQPESTALNYLGLMFFQNVFFNLNPRPNESPAVGLHPINSCFNHSCVQTRERPSYQRYQRKVCNQ